MEQRTLNYECPIPLPLFVFYHFLMYDKNVRVLSELSRYDSIFWPLIVTFTLDGTKSMRNMISHSPGPRSHLI